MAQNLEYIPAGDFLTSIFMDEHSSVDKPDLMVYEEGRGKRKADR